MDFMHQKINLIIIAFCVCFSVEAQDLRNNELLNKVNDFYKNTTEYTIQMMYNVYKDGDERKPIESYTGKFIKKGDYSKIALLNSEAIQISDKKLVIDHTNKAISYSKAESEITTSPLDLNSYLNFYELTCVDEQEQQTVYHLQLKNDMFSIPYSKVVLYINNKDFYITKQELLLSSKLQFKMADGSEKWGAAKLSIVMQLQHNVIEQKLRISDFVTSLPDGNRQVTKKYKKYQLVDLTKQ